MVVVTMSQVNILIVIGSGFLYFMILGQFALFQFLGLLTNWNKVNGSMLLFREG